MGRPSISLPRVEEKALVYDPGGDIPEATRKGRIGHLNDLFRVIGAARQKAPVSGPC